MKLPIRVRLTAAYALLLAAVVAAVGAFVVVRLRADLIAGVDDALVPATRQIAIGYDQEGAPELRDTASTVLAGPRRAAQLVATDGRVLVRYGDRVAARPLLPAAAAARAPLTRTVRLEDGTAFRVAARPARGGVVIAAQSLTEVDATVHRLLVELLIACPVALLASALGGWWLAGRALRPVDRMTRRAGQIGPERLDERLAVPATRDEIARLAETLNAMLDRVQAGVEARHRLVADASHELRTPLAAMRAELDVSLVADDLEPAARAVLVSTREEVDRMSRTVDDLLTLAGIDEDRLELLIAPVDLADLARGAAGALGALAAARGVTVSCEADPAAVSGDGDRLRHAIRNLLENAIEFSPAGGEVVVKVWRHGDAAGVTVTDEGPGVAPELRERVFERFFRADPSRSRATCGSGLGLAIAREIAVAHGGRVWVEPHDPRGAAFSLALPAAAVRTPYAPVAAM
jgi:heavy metal sensor kinase